MRPRDFPTRLLRWVARHAWTSLGLVALALGLIGIVLPLLPTTPFVLLAAFAFSKGSPRLHAAIERHPRFGPILAEWRARGAIAPRHKALAVGMMTATFAASIAASLGATILAVQAVCMGGAALYVLSRPNGRN